MSGQHLQRYILFLYARTQPDAGLRKSKHVAECGFYYTFCTKLWAHMNMQKKKKREEPHHITELWLGESTRTDGGKLR